MPPHCRRRVLFASTSLVLELFYVALCVPLAPHHRLTVRRMRSASRRRRKMGSTAPRRLTVMAAAAVAFTSALITPAASQSVTFAYSGSTASFATPFSGIYTITALGAQGGSSSFSGGMGAQASGIFSLTANEVLTIAVGGAGAFKTYSGGGGGGSFVVAPGTIPLVIAGGGGGVGYSSNNPGPGDDHDERRGRVDPERAHRRIWRHERERGGLGTGSEIGGGGRRLRV